MNKKKILIIEDDTLVRELYDHVLTNAGFEVAVALNGEDGIKAAGQKTDLILLDMMLPRIDGLEVLSNLKASKETQNIPVMMLTNLGQEDIIKKTLKMGAVSYLIKVQLKPKDIVSEVKSYFEKHSDPGS